MQGLARRVSRLARFLRSTGEPGLEALQARAVADPAWFWGAAVDDLGLSWQRPPDQLQQGQELIRQYHVDTSGRLTNCSVCHR